MQLMMGYTFDRNLTKAKIRAGKYRNIRLFAGPLNFDFATNRTDIFVIAASQAGDPKQNFNKLSIGGWRMPHNLVDEIPNGHNAKPFYRETEFDGVRMLLVLLLLRLLVLTPLLQFYSTCWYTFEKLTDSLIAEGKTPPPFGLVAVAVGGTKIAQWVGWDAQVGKPRQPGGCRNVTCCTGRSCTQNADAPWQVKNR